MTPWTLADCNNQKLITLVHIPRSRVEYSVSEGDYIEHDHVFFEEAFLEVGKDSGLEL